MSLGNFGGGTGTQSNPYLVEDLLDLNAIRNNSTAHYKLVNDIDASLTSLTAVGLEDSGKGWAPIRGSTAGSTAFTGGINFNLHKITNLYINRPGVDRIGFIGQLNSLDITRARIINADITGGSFTGILAGDSSSKITNCKVSGKVYGVNNVGGIIGYFSGVAGIEDAKAELIEITGVNNVGGAVGVSGGAAQSPLKDVIVECSGSIKGVSNVSGILGYSSSASTFTDVYFLGKTIERLSGTSTYFSDINCGAAGNYTRVGSMSDLVFFYY